MRNLIDIRRKIPANYLSEFVTKRTLLIKNRVRLLCILAVSLYTCTSILSAVVLPEEFERTEIPAWFALVIGSALIVYLAWRAKTIKTAKLTAYLFVILILAILTKISIIYYPYVDVVSSVYLLTLFLTCFIIPWRAFEVLPISLLHFLAYSTLFLYVKNYLPDFTPVRPYWYFDGIILLTVGVILCFIIRLKETGREIENFILLKEIKEKNAQMQKELELATRVHARLIPHSISTDQADIAATYVPAYYMGGDYGRFNFSTDKKLTFIICDVTGHGVSAALLVNALHSEFEGLAKEEKEPGFLLKDLDTFIKRDFAQTNMYLSAFCGLLDFESMKFIYSNYGHPPQYIYKRASSNIQRIAPQTGWLGLPVEHKTIHQDQMSFNKGDQILLFTDGIVEAKDSTGELYGDERLENFVQKSKDLKPESFNKKLLLEVNSFTNNNLEDDIFILNILIK